MTGSSIKASPDRFDNIGTPDRIKYKQGPAERDCRVVKWDGSQFIIIVDRGGGKNIRRELTPDVIDYLKLAHRWGKATGRNGITVPILVKRYSDNLIWFIKKEGDREIEKEAYPIDKFAEINF